MESLSRTCATPFGGWSRARRFRWWRFCRSASASASTPRCSRWWIRCCSGRCRSHRPRRSSTSSRPAATATSTPPSSYADFLDLKAQNTVFSDMIGYSPMMAPLSLGDRSRIALGQVVTSNHFSMLGVQPLLGRLLVPSDDDAGAARVVVISHRMWRREFGSDPAIAGKSLTLRGLAVHDRRRGAGIVHRRRAAADARSSGCRSSMSKKSSPPASTTRCRRRSGRRASSGAACAGCSSRAG